MRNASLHIKKLNSSNPRVENANFLNLPIHEDHNIKILCNTVKMADQNLVMLIAHYTVGW